MGPRKKEPPSALTLGGFGLLSNFYQESKES